MVCFWLNEIEMDYLRIFPCTHRIVFGFPASLNVKFSYKLQALNRCNPRKVFKAASSFSYRRMLPYLMNIANDASG